MPNFPESPFRVRPAFIIFLMAFVLRITHIYFLIPFLDHEYLFNDGVYFHRLALALTHAVYDLKTPPLGGGLSPVYVGFMVLIYSLISPQTLFVRIVQVLLGAFSCVGLYRITRHLFGMRAGLIAGALAAFCGVFIYFDTVLLKPALVNVLLIGFFWIIQKNWKRFFVPLIAGGLFALICMLRMQAALVAPVLLVLGWYLLRKEGWKEQLKQFLLVAGSFVAVTAIVLGWFISTIGKTQAAPPAGEFFTPQSGIHFYIGNFKGANGAYTRIPGVRASSLGHVVDARKIAERDLGHSLNMNEVNDYWLKKTLDEIFQNPLAWVKLELNKFFLIWNDYEIPDSANYEYWRHFSPVLKLPLVRYGWLAPLALLGWIRLRRDTRPEILTLSFFSIFYILALLLTFETTDYRLPLYPVWIVFAAYTLDRLPHDLTASTKSSRIKLGLLFGLFFVFCNYQTCLNPAKYNRHAYWRHVRVDPGNRSKIDLIAGVKTTKIPSENH